jgi:hypothetical protein
MHVLLQYTIPNSFFLGHLQRATQIGHVKWPHVFVSLARGSESEYMCYIHHVTTVIILFVQGGIFDNQTSCKSTYSYALLILSTRFHGIFPILWSIREMCCITSVLGHNVHMNAYQTHIKFFTNIISLMNCYCPLQLKKGVDKWTHEPQSYFNHKKHIFITFILFSICSTILIRK